jgi:hypothetical protein
MMLAAPLAAARYRASGLVHWPDSDKRLSIKVARFRMHSGPRQAIGGVFPPFTPCSVGSNCQSSPLYDFMLADYPTSGQRALDRLPPSQS